MDRGRRKGSLDRGRKMEGGRKDCIQNSPYELRILEGVLGLYNVYTFKENGRGIGEGHKASVGQQV